MTDRTVTVSLSLQIRDYTSATEQVVAANTSITESLGAAGAAGEEHLNEIANAAAAVGLALAGVAGFAVKASMDFEKAMSGVKAATNASNQEMKQLSAAALQAGKDTVFSATEAAAAEGELAKAGVKTADILGGALKGSLDLAAAGQIEVAEAAEVAADVMSIWGLKGTQVSHVADVISAAAGKSSTNVKLMSDSIQQAGLVANQVGFSLEETAGVLAAFAHAGLKGSDAGTSLKTMLLRLTAPTQDVTSRLESLGIEVYDSSGSFVDAATLAGQLSTALRGLDEQSRNAALGTIFGADAVRAANVLYEEGASGIRNWIHQANDMGYAARSAGILTDNLAGDFERLKGSMEVAAIQGGSGLAKVLRTMTQQADAAVTSFSNLPGPIQTGITTIMGITGVGLLAVAGFLRLKTATASLATSLATLGPAGVAAGNGLNRVVGFAGRLGGVVLAFGALGMVLSSFTRTTQIAVPALAQKLEEFGRSGKAAGEASIAFGKDLELLKYDMETLDTGALASASRGVAAFAEALTFGAAENWDKSLVNAKRRINDLDAALAQLVQSGRADAAKQAFDKVAAVAKEQGTSVENLTKALPQYRSALAGANAEQTAAIEAAEKGKAATQKLAGGFLNAVVAAKSFEDAIKGANGALATLLGAEISAEAAIDDLTTSVKENGTSLDINTEKGRANLSAILQGRDAAVAAAQAKYEETRATQSESAAANAATAVYGGYIERLRSAAKAAGLNKDQVDALINTYASMPALKATQIQTPGLPQAIGDAERYTNRLQYIPRSVTTYVETVYTVGKSGVKAMAAGGVVEYAATGLIKEAGLYGPGTMYAFAEPSTGGEAFIPRYGDMQRSRDIADHVVSRWLGGQVLWGGRAGGQGQAITINVYAQQGQSAHEVAAMVKRELAWAN